MTIACLECGTLQSVPPLPRGVKAECRRCGHQIQAAIGCEGGGALVCAWAALLLLIPGNALTLMSVSMLSHTRPSVPAFAVIVLWRQEWALLAIAIGAFVVVLPIVRFILLVGVLSALRLGYRPPWLGSGFRWAVRLAPWAMIDVFLLGAVVGYTRVVTWLPANIGTGGWCLAAAGLLAMSADASLDRRTVWRAIAPERPRPDGPALSCTACLLVLPMAKEGGRCPRCRARLVGRKPDSLRRTMALVATGFVFYGPANIYPMTSMISMGDNQQHTIFSGIGQLVDEQLWPLAILIFCTSIAIPLLKLVALTWFVISVRLRARRGLMLRTRLHRFIGVIGRWSFIDVFTIAVFAPLMQFGPMATVHAGPGAVAFMLVVVATMLATFTFDPRLMWDAAEVRE